MAEDRAFILKGVAGKSLHEIEGHVLSQRGVCLHCNAEFVMRSVRGRPSPDGIQVYGFSNPYRVYFYCRRCGFASPLEKILRWIAARDRAMRRGF